MRKTATCPDCQSSSGKYISEIPSSYVFAGKVLEAPIEPGSLFECGDCHLYWREPRLGKTQLDVLYKNANISVWHARNDKRPDWLIANKIIKAEQNKACVLDVGCSDGRFLNQLGGIGVKYGIELHPEAACIASEHGVKIIGNDFSVMRNLSMSFDIVVTMDVIEHVERPYEFLESIAGITRPGGLIVISTGTTDAWSWKVMRGMYWYCHNAEHISFINSNWCKNSAAALGLSMEQLIRFSHEDRKSVGYLVQLTSNILYRFAPTLALILRRLYSSLSGRKNRPTDSTPPQWRMAKDHLLVAFRKQK